MSFGGAAGPSEETLSYYIRAIDLATPVFRAFRGEVEATTRGAQASMASMNRSFVEQQTAYRNAAGVSRAAAGEQAVFARESRAAGGAAAASGTQVRKAGSEFAEHRREVSEAGYALSGFSNQLGPLGRSLDNSAKHARLFRDQGLDYMAAGLVGLSAVTIAYGIKQASTFEQIQRNMEQQAGVSSRTSKQMLADVEAVGQKAPASFEDIGKAVAAQVKLFGNNADQIKKNTDLYLAFSDQAKAQVVPTIQAISNVMRQFKPAGMDTTDVMDQLVNLSQKTQRPLGDFLNLLSRYGPQLQAMGLGFKGTVGLFDQMSKAGVSTSLMGRGLSTALSYARTQITGFQTALKDGPQKLSEYANSVDSAQIRVNTLNGQIAAGKGDQQKYRDELVIANRTLTDAKDKYATLTTTLHEAKTAHQSVSDILGTEMKKIEDAKTKQDALNESNKVFGTRLGPAMADALFHNKHGLVQMDEALGNAHGKTENLAKAQRDSLHGQMKIMENDFKVVAASVGQVAIPPLKTLVGVVKDVAQAVAGLPKPVLDALVFGGLGVGASALVMRHTPLGGVVSNAVGGPTWLKTMLTGKSPTGQAIAGVGPGGVGGMGAGGIVGFDGNPVAAGSIMNPIAVQMVGGMGGVPGAVGAAEGEAAMGGEAAAVGGISKGGVLLPTGVAAPAEEVALETSRTSAITGAIGTGFSGLMRGGMIAGMGVLAAQAAGGIIGGKTGHTVASIGTDAAIGAGIGSVIPGLGTAAGAVGGVGVGALLAFIKGHPGVGDTAQSRMDVAGAAHSQGFATMIGRPVALSSVMSASDTQQTERSGKALKAFDDQVNSVHGDLSKLSTKQLQAVQKQAIALANDPSLSDYQKTLQETAASTEKALVQKAAPAFQQMADEAGHSLAEINLGVKVSGVMIPQILGKGSQAGQQALAKNFLIAVQDVQQSMAKGVVSTSAGLNEINKLMAGALKSLGVNVTAGDVKAIGLDQATALLSGPGATGGTGSSSLQGVNAGGGSSGLTLAQGGRVPGPVGPDSWTLVDPSGRAQAHVGGGELLVANRHSEAALSRASMAVYGKTAGQIVAGEKYSHTAAPGYASGGVVTASFYTDHGTGAFGLVPDVQGVPGFAELNGGTALGHLGGGAKIDVTLGGRTIRGLPELDTGAGGPGLDGHVRAIDFTMPAAQEIGFPFGAGIANVTWTPAGGGGGGGVGSGVGMPGVAAPKIKQPKWSGPGGTIGQIGNAVLKKVTAAANKALAAKAAASGAGAGVSLMPGQHRHEVAPKHAPPGLQQMFAEANAIASHNYNYEWGGGHSSIGVPSHWDGTPSHGSGPGVGFDCSGAVSAVLNAAGLLSTPLDAAGFMSWGSPGPGKFVNIFADPDHTFMQLAGNYFGTSTAENPGGGANWIPVFPGNIGGPRHPPGFEKGGFVYDERNHDSGHRVRNHMPPGMARGGRLPHAGAFGKGGIVTANKPTSAVFGDKGAETAIFIPHTGDFAGIGDQFTTNAAAPTVAPGSYPPSSSTTTPKPSQRINPLTGQIETHTPLEWLQIEQEYHRTTTSAAAQRHQDALKKAAHNKWLSQNVTDTLTLMGLPAGQIEASRRTLQGEKLPLGGNMPLTGTLKALDKHGFDAVITALKAQLAGDTEAQTMGLAKSITHEIATGKAKGPRAQQIANVILTAAGKSVATALTGQENRASDEQNVMQLLEQAPVGSTAKSLGLSHAMLHSIGLTKREVHKLAGRDSGSAAYAQQIKQITDQEIPQFQSDAKRLQRLYKDALKDHNKKLADSLKTQLDGVTQALLKAQGDLATAQIAQIDAQYQKASDKAQKQQGSSDILSAIQALAPGTNLASMGLTPKVLKGLGVDPKQAASLEGSGIGYLQQLQQTQQAQGGQLTPAQMAQAWKGTAAQETLLSGQRSTDIGEVAKLQKELPHLKGKARDDANQHISDLVKSILSLTDTMNQNNTALASLTQATNDNTTATGQMTGSVGYTYQSQDYVAGGNSSSETFSNMRVGM